MVQSDDTSKFAGLDSENSSTLIAPRSRHSRLSGCPSHPRLREVYHLRKMQQILLDLNARLMFYLLGNHFFHSQIFEIFLFSPRECYRSRRCNHHSGRRQDSTLSFNTLLCGRYHSCCRSKPLSFHFHARKRRNYLPY